MTAVVPEQSQLRQLPQRTRPLQNETIGSFLARLGKRNGLTGQVVSNVVKDSGLPTLDAIAMLTGLPSTSLLAAVPELRNPVPKSMKRIQHRYLGFDGTTIACQHCAAHNGQHQATVWSHNHDAVCLRHRRWVGSPALHTDTQLSLLTAPEIVAANRHHRRLAQRHGSESIGTAFLSAVTMVEDWHRRGSLPRVRDRVLELFLGAAQTFTLTTAPQVQAAQYPTAIRLTHLLMTREWLDMATSGSVGWNHAARDITQQVTGGFKPSTVTLDALVQLRQLPTARHGDHEGSQHDHAKR